MILSKSHQFLFIHNYKVAGVSIKNALKDYNDVNFFSLNFKDKIKYILGHKVTLSSRKFPGHVKIKEVRPQLSEEVFNSYYKFGFVRDPWDWQVSLYNFARQTPHHKQHKLTNSFGNFDEYLEWRVNEELFLQKDFFYDQDECLMDFIGKFENINADFEHICNKIGIECKLPHTNKSARSSNYLNYYSKNSIDLIADAFSEDIRLFNYSRPIIR